MLQNLFQAWNWHVFLYQRPHTQAHRHTCTVWAQIKFTEIKTASQTRNEICNRNFHWLRFPPRADFKYAESRLEHTNRISKSINSACAFEGGKICENALLCYIGDGLSGGKGKV